MMMAANQISVYSHTPISREHRHVESGSALIIGTEKELCPVRSYMLYSPAFQSMPESRPGRAQVDTWNCGSGLPWMALARNAAAARAAEPECTHANAAAEAATVMVGESRLEAGEPREKAKAAPHTHRERERERERERRVHRHQRARDWG